MKIGNSHRTPSEDSGLLWWSSTAYGLDGIFTASWKKVLARGLHQLHPERPPSHGQKAGDRCVSQYIVMTWQNSNCNSLSVLMRLRQPCAALTHIFSLICISSHLCLCSSSSSRGRRGSYPSLLTSEHGRDAATVQLCPAVQTVCIKRACVVLSLTLERGTEGRCESQRERNKSLWEQMIEHRLRRRSDARWNDGMEWEDCRPEKKKIFLDSFVNFHGGGKKQELHTMCECVSHGPQQ